MGDGPSIFVAGLGRCGTTMVMTMLARGGMPVVGRAPSYEPDEMMPGEVPRAFIEAAYGKALKWIDPNVTRIALGRFALSIWLARDPFEQARSQLKLIGLNAPRGKVRALASLIRRDAVKARSAVARHGLVLDLAFEQILADPLIHAERISDFLARHGGGALDVRAAAAAVLPRSPKCAAGLDIELRLMQEAGRHV